MVPAAETIADLWQAVVCQLFRQCHGHLPGGARPSDCAAVARTVGWISQWKEMISDPQLKIGRPRQLYQGETFRDYVDIENR